MKKKLISLFAGAGGFDLGFEQSGWWKTVLANDFHPKMIDTLRYNQGKIFQNQNFLENAQIVEGDIVENIDEIGSFKADLVLGGPPCQSFSAIGSQEGYGSDRGGLIFSFADIIERVDPDYFLFENVPNLKSSKWISLFEDFITYLGFSERYVVKYFLLNCADFGCATVRERIFIFGCHTRTGKKPTAPQPTHSAAGDLFSLTPHVTVSDAIDDLSSASLDFSFPDLHFAPRHEPEIVSRFNKLAPGERDPIRRRNRLFADKPAYTLFAGGEKGGTRAHIHPTQPREVTPREMARIHGFPDNFSFCGNKSQIAIQLANSVPIPIAHAWGHHIGSKY